MTIGGLLSLGVLRMDTMGVRGVPRPLVGLQLGLFLDRGVVAVVGLATGVVVFAVICGGTAGERGDDVTEATGGLVGNRGMGDWVAAVGEGCVVGTRRMEDPRVDGVVISS